MNYFKATQGTNETFEDLRTWGEEDRHERIL